MDTQSEIQVGGKINFEAAHPFCLESSGLICMDDFVLEYIYTVEERPGSEWASCNQELVGPVGFFGQLFTLLVESFSSSGKQFKLHFRRDNLK